MSKRKLSFQQRRRIAEQREKKKAEREQRSTLLDIEKLENDTLGELQSGLVTSHFGREVVIEGEQLSQQCHLRANLELCTGDKVSWRAGSEKGVVESRESRNSEIQRPDSYGKLRTVAANVSQLLITVAPQPEAHSSLIDRYLVAAHFHALNPIILINKSDLIDENHSKLIQLKSMYNTLGYQHLSISCKTGHGIDKLLTLLQNNTSIFVGQSGVGKSSLVNCLLPDEDIRIGALSESEVKGRHTTTHSQLYRFPSGGYCIDSPGIREFGLWHATEDDVLAGFPEIEKVSGQCRFRDCSHETEPGCAIHQAIESGEILPERYTNYKNIINQLDDVTIKTKSGIKNR